MDADPPGRRPSPRSDLDPVFCVLASASSRRPNRRPNRRSRAPRRRYVTFTLTYPGCPIGPQVSEQIKEFVGGLEGVDGVHPKMVFDPPWTPEMMSEDAKFALGF
jgi:hypothetical protein